MSEGSTAELIRRCFAAYDTADREAMESLLAPGFTFTSPYDDHIDRAAYFERCWPGAGSFASRELTRIVVDGNEGFVLYDAVGGEGSRFRNT